MANPIIEKMDEFGNTVVQMQKKYDEALDEQKKGNEVRFEELNRESDKLNQKATELQKMVKTLIDANEKQSTQLEMLEALSSRPKGTPSEQLETKHAQTFLRYVRSGMRDTDLKHQCMDLYKQEMEAKDINIGTALTGGNAVPSIIGRQIEDLLLKQSEIVAEVKMVNAGSGDYSELVTIHGANGGWSAETGTRSNNTTPNLRKVTTTHGELYAYPKVSNWSLNDIFFDVSNWLVNENAETFAVTLSTAIHAGTGSNQPTGMTNSAPVNTDDTASPQRAAAVYEYVATGSSPTSTALNGDDLIDLAYSINARYRGNAKFAMNSATQGVVRKLKDSYGQYLWQTNFQVGQPPTLLGKPIITWEDMANDAAANALPVAYGDFRKAYLLSKIGPMTMITNEVSTPGYTQFYTAQRYGGIPLNNNAVKFLKLAAS